MAAEQLKPRLVIFDLDGTLGDLPVDWSALKRDVELHFKARSGSAASFSFWEGIRMLKDRLDPVALKEAYGIIQRYEQGGAANFIPNEPAIEYLRSVATRGGKTAICSNNMTSTINAVLERLKIRSQVSFIVGMDSVSKAKPNPEGLLQILQRADVTNADAIFIGDTNTDRQAARAASIPLIAVDELPTLL